MECEIRLISAETSTTTSGDPQIQLFGRAMDGKSYTLLIDNFLPYCYIKKNDHGLNVLKNEPDIKIIKTEDIELEYEMKKELYTKIYFKHPGNISKARKSNPGKYLSWFAADILFPLRYIYDNNLNACIIASGSDIKTPRDGFTTDHVIKVETIKNSDKDFFPNLTILSFDIECSMLTNETFTISIVVEKQEKKYFKLIGEETYILKEFERIVKETDPDVITGYNIVFFDLKRIYERASELQLNLSLARNSSPFESSYGTWSTEGRIIADAWMYIKSEKKPKRETLRYVAHEYLKQEKFDVNSKEIDNEWNKNRFSVMDYCLQDSILALELLKYVKIIDKYLNIGTVSKLPLSYIFTNKTTLNIDSLMIREFDKYKFAVPCTKPHKHNDEDEEDSIEGAYVHEPKSGLFNYVCVLDFKSMYPNIIRKNNLCLSTYDPKNGEIVSPIGAKFIKPEKRIGIAPMLMQKLLNDRAVIKKEMKKWKDKDKNMYDYYDRLQYGVKVLANSFYGAFASNFYRFTNHEIGASITAYARENIKNLIGSLQSKGIEVIAGDTDSAFLISPYPDIELSVVFGQELEKTISSEGYDIEFEKILNPYFTHGKKKRYVGMIVWPGKPEIFTRGYETRRTDSFDMITSNMECMFELILKEKPDEAVTYAKKVIKELKSGRITNISQLVISKMCKPLDQYKHPDTLPQVQAAKKLSELGQPFTPYMKVSFIITNASTSPQTIEPFIDGNPFPHTPDWDYYSQRTARALGRITEAFGWTDEDLLSSTRQNKLEEFM